MQKLIVLFTLTAALALCGCNKTNNAYVAKVNEAHNLCALEYFDRAMLACNDAIELDDSRPEAYQARARAKVGTSAQAKTTNAKNKALRSALKDLDEAAYRGGPVANSTRFYALHYLGKNKEALEVADTLISQNVNDGNAHFMRGLIMLETGKKEEARLSFQRAQTLGEDVGFWLRQTDK